MDALKTLILQRALPLLDAEGLGVSTAALARAAGVSNGTLFHHFPTKAALLRAVYVHVDQAVSAAALAAPPAPAALAERLQRCWHQAARYALAHPAAFRYALRYRLGPPGVTVPEFGPPAWLLQVGWWLDQAAGDVPRPAPLRTLAVAHFAGLWQATVQTLLDAPVPAGQFDPWLERAFNAWWAGRL